MTLSVIKKAYPAILPDNGTGFLQLTEDRLNVIYRARFIEKLDVAFALGVPDFAVIDHEERQDFLLGAILLAQTKGLNTEQGIASYVLALWWLGIDFEQENKELASLLRSTYPEVRRTYAMNEWAHAVIGDPDNLAAANETLKQAFCRTKDWSH